MLSGWRRQGEGRLPSQRGAAAGTDAHGRARSHKTWRAMSTDSCCRRRPCPDAMAANCTTGMSGGLVGDGADSTYRRWTEGSWGGGGGGVLLRWLEPSRSCTPPPPHPAQECRNTRGTPQMYLLASDQAATHLDLGSAGIWISQIRRQSSQARTRKAKQMSPRWSEGRKGSGKSRRLASPRVPTRGKKKKKTAFAISCADTPQRGG